MRVPCLFVSFQNVAVLCNDCSYVVQSFAGEGTFGKVARCLKGDTNKSVAIKIFKGGRRFESALEEVITLLLSRRKNIWKL